MERKEQGGDQQEGDVVEVGDIAKRDEHEGVVHRHHENQPVENPQGNRRQAIVLHEIGSVPHGDRERQYSSIRIGEAHVEYAANTVLEWKPEEVIAMGSFPVAKRQQAPRGRGRNVELDGFVIGEGYLE